jgi:hypothetical protein
MKNLNITIIFILLNMALFHSCVEPNYEMEDYQSKIVIDGWIEQGKFPQVLLTLSAPYFSEIDSASLRDYALTRAKATISNGDRSEVLTLKPNHDYFPPYLYIGTSIKGEIGKTYTLTVEFDGETASATTTIPEPVKLDSVWFELEPGKDSLGLLWLHFTDPVDSKNYYRTLTQVENEDNKYIPTYFPNFNDEFFNGQEIKISLYKGNKVSTDKVDELFYTLGDTIILKATTIDKASYEFWVTFQKEIINTGNPFASTNARVQSNVSNGLGVWCGYGSSYYRVIAQ